jgi:hypothetical protein
MPDKDEHVGQLRHNYAFLTESQAKCNISTTFPDWFFTIRFYICVHIVEAILATVNVHSDNHDDRHVKIARLRNQFRDDFEKHYRDMYNTSVRARYSTKIHRNIKTRVLEENERSFNYIISYAKEKYNITCE